MNDSSPVSTMPNTAIPATTQVPSYNYGYGNTQPPMNGQPVSPAVSGFAFGMLILVCVVCYGYFSYIFYRLAKKTGIANPGLAWVPLVNIYTYVKIAGKPGWWVILLFIPLVNIVIGIILWMNIARRVGKPDYLGILMIIPGVNLVIPAYLAFAGPTITPPPAPLV